MREPKLQDAMAFLAFMRTALYAFLLIFICAHLNSGIQDIKVDLANKNATKMENLILLANATYSTDCYKYNYSANPVMTATICRQYYNPMHTIKVHVMGILSSTYSACEAKMLTEWLQRCAIPPEFKPVCDLKEYEGELCAILPDMKNTTRLCYNNTSKKYSYFTFDNGIRLFRKEFEKLLYILPVGKRVYHYN